MFGPRLCVRAEQLARNRQGIHPDSSPAAQAKLCRIADLRQTRRSFSIFGPARSIVSLLPTRRLPKEPVKDRPQLLHFLRRSNGVHRQESVRAKTRDFCGGKRKASGIAPTEA